MKNTTIEGNAKRNAETISRKLGAKSLEQRAAELEKTGMHRSAAYTQAVNEEMRAGGDGSTFPAPWQTPASQGTATRPPGAPLGDGKPPEAEVASVPYNGGITNVQTFVAPPRLDQIRQKALWNERFQFYMANNIGAGDAAYAASSDVADNLDPSNPMADPMGGSRVNRASPTLNGAKSPADPAAWPRTGSAATDLALDALRASGFSYDEATAVIAKAAPVAKSAASIEPSCGARSEVRYQVRATADGVELIRDAAASGAGDEKVARTFVRSLSRGGK